MEFLHPGVYISEIPLAAHPIDGVSTSTDPAPGWTDANAHDPGVSLVELHAWLAESLAFRAGGGMQAWHAAAMPGLGMIDGLQVSAGAGHEPDLAVAPGCALSPWGRRLDP